MTTKSVKDPDFGDWQVRDLTTGEILDRVQYADDETGLYIVRERTDRGVTINRVVTGAKIKLEDKRLLGKQEPDPLLEALESARAVVAHLEEMVREREAWGRMISVAWITGTVE